MRFGNPSTFTSNISDQRPTVPDLFDLDFIAGLHG